MSSRWSGYSKFDQKVIQFPHVRVGKWLVGPAVIKSLKQDKGEPRWPLIDKKPGYLSIRLPFCRYNLCFHKADS